MRNARTPQERKKFLLNKMKEKRINNVEKVSFRTMSDLDIVIHEKAYKWHKENRGGIYDE